MNVLLTCVGRRRYLVDYFKSELNGAGMVFGVDNQRSAPAANVCDAFLVAPDIYAESYIDFLVDVCRNHRISALLSLNDLELPLIARHAQRLREVGTVPIVSSPEVVHLCADKFVTSQFAESIGIATPRSYATLQSAEEALDTGEVSFPLVVKPRWGSASFGIFFVENRDELRFAHAYCARIWKQSKFTRMGEADALVLVQEMIVGQEYGLDIFNDLEGQPLGLAARLKLSMRAGETDRAITVENGPFSDMAARISRALRHIGNVDCDVIERDGRLYLLEMNPRFGGGYPFSHIAGANLIRVLLSCLRGDYNGEEVRYQSGLEFAKCDFLASVEPPVLQRPQAAESVTCEGQGYA
ncbi:ATP-grasp domain-containing protein [Cupriavidus pinatubonensis]|uniref:D-alanine--D-alanine ligase n=1 Tax=Cupriavidus pinatubonensis TaxID=248026 RepID=A0ABN7ZIR7_9BURK|nr:ATP-grasp domain-containing protein [Cupriavidus pinatubonensis]CAG9185048.1 D-alanine--D-alanine ligase [Cupriavidus pinatubonensis]